MWRFLSIILFSSCINSQLVPKKEPDNLTEIDCTKVKQEDLLDVNAIFFCTESKSIMVNSIQVKTPDGVKDRRKWVQIACARVKKAESIVEPVTTCISLQHGHAGAMTFSKLDTISFLAGSDLSFALFNVLYAKFSAGLSVDLSASLSRGNEISCAGKPGDVVQIMASKTAYHLVDGKFRYLEASKVKKKVVHGDWKDIPDALAIPPFVHYMCVTDPVLMQCDGVMTTPSEEAPI